MGTGSALAASGAWVQWVHYLSTFASVARGHFTLDVCHADFGCGAFEGPFKGEGAPGGQGMLTGVGHGTGDFHTMQLRSSVVERGNTEVLDLDAIIF